MLGTIALSQVTWYLTRSSGLVGFALLTATVVLGVLGAERFETSRHPRIHYAELHRGLALFGATMLVVHVITAVLDPFTHLGLASLFDPFGRSYRPLYLGLGIASSDVMIAVIISSLVRQKMTPKAWHLLHLAVYPIWLAGIIHGLGTGTDSKFLPIQAFYLLTLAAVVVSVWIRVLSGNPRTPLARVGAGALALFIPGALVAWAISGPMKGSWSHRFVAKAAVGVSVTTPTNASSSLPTSKTSQTDGGADQAESAS